MQLLTPSGYKNIEDCQIGEQLIAYDINDGSIIINQLLDKKWMNEDIFEDEYSEAEYDNYGNIIVEAELIRTKKKIYEETYGELSAYKINDTWSLYWGQSVWANLNVIHAQDLKIGDIIYNDDDNDIIITSIEKIEVDGWWRLSVSGDHSYIADDLTLHNATRYWVGGGASANWNATANTNWGSASGGANNASVPTSVDDVIFDGAGTNGNTNSTISATITILSLDIQTGYTATMTHNAVLTIAGNWTFTGNYTIAGGSSITISATSTINSNGVTWINAITISNLITITLASDLTINGLVTASVFNGKTINKTTSEKLILVGGLNYSNSGSLVGTADIYFKGGTITPNSNTNIQIVNNIFFDGNVNLIAATYSFSANITYVSGSINASLSTLLFSFTNVQTFNTKGINWNNITFNIGYNVTRQYTLDSDLDIYGILSYTNNGGTTTSLLTINTSNGSTINCYNGLSSSTINFGDTTPPNIMGSANIYLRGGIWTGGCIENNLFIDGNITIRGTVGVQKNTTTYLSGTVDSRNATLLICAATGTGKFANFVNIDKIIFKQITIFGGITITMNEFFTGFDNNICQISSSSTTNYTITFTDNFEKIARNVSISRATVSRPNQLFVVTNPLFNTNRSTNAAGIRYINQLPNGFSKKLSNIYNTISSPNMLVSDLNFIKQG